MLHSYTISWRSGPGESFFVFWTKTAKKLENNWEGEGRST